MYIKKIEKWCDKEWGKFFSYFPLLSSEERLEVKQILTLPEKSWIEANFERLEELWILNGIWPFWFPNKLREFITWLFPYFRYEHHDLAGCIWGTEADRKESDKGMLKYTTLSIQEKTIERIATWNSLLIWYNLFISVPFKYFVAFVFYILVRIFGRFGSFNYH